MLDKELFGFVLRNICEIFIWFNFVVNPNRYKYEVNKTIIIFLFLN